MGHLAESLAGLDDFEDEEAVEEHDDEEGYECDKEAVDEQVVDGVEVEVTAKVCVTNKISFNPIYLLLNIRPFQKLWNRVDSS